MKSDRITSRNSMKHLGSILEFLYKYVDLERFDIIVQGKHFCAEALDPFCPANAPDVFLTEIKIRKRAIFGGTAFSLIYNEHFNDFISLPKSVVKSKYL